MSSGVAYRPETTLASVQATERGAAAGGLVRVVSIFFLLSALVSLVFIVRDLMNGKEVNAVRIMGCLVAVIFCGLAIAKQRMDAQGEELRLETEEARRRSSPGVQQHCA